MIDIKGIFKKILHRGDDFDFDNIGEADLGSDLGTELEPKTPGTSVQNPFPQESFHNTPEFNVSPQMHMPNIPNISQPNLEIQQIFEHIKLINNKLDILNAKIDQLQQRITLLEQYFTYRR